MTKITRGQLPLMGTLQLQSVFPDIYATPDFSILLVALATMHQSSNCMNRDSGREFVHGSSAHACEPIRGSERVLPTLPPCSLPGRIGRPGLVLKGWFQHMNSSVEYQPHLSNSLLPCLCHQWHFQIQYNLLRAVGTIRSSVALEGLNWNKSSFNINSFPHADSPFERHRRQIYSSRTDLNRDWAEAAQCLAGRFLMMARWSARSSVLVLSLHICTVIYEELAEFLEFYWFHETRLTEFVSFFSIRSMPYKILSHRWARPCSQANNTGVLPQDETALMSAPRSIKHLTTSSLSNIAAHNKGVISS